MEVLANTNNSKLVDKRISTVAVISQSNAQFGIYNLRSEQNLPLCRVWLQSQMCRLHPFTQRPAPHDTFSHLSTQRRPIRTPAERSGSTDTRGVADRFETLTPFMQPMNCPAPSTGTRVSPDWLLGRTADWLNPRAATCTRSPAGTADSSSVTQLFVARNRSEKSSWLISWPPDPFLSSAVSCPSEFSEQLTRI